MKSGLPLALTVLLFLWEGIRFNSVGPSIVPLLEIIGTLFFLTSLPLRRTSHAEAYRIYAWFLFASALMAYADYEIMTGKGLWFIDRTQNDPGKYFDAVQMGIPFSSFNDPGFVWLLQTLWDFMEIFGKPTFLCVVNCVMVLSSVFAVCCLEVSRYLAPNARTAPYFFVFNPLVLGLNLLLMRDILLGAIGWSAVLCGLVFLSDERRSRSLRFGAGFGFVAGCVAVYFLRTVSGAFFVATTVAMAISRGRKLNKVYIVAIILGIAWVGAATAQGLLGRSGRFVERGLTAEGRIEGSVGSLVAAGGLPFRTILITGGTFVYGLPFWRVPQPVLLYETSIGAGSLFAQLFTALPLLMGIGLLIRRPRLTGWAILAIYFGWCFLSALMLQMHTRYITSHLLPIIAAIGCLGWENLWVQRNPNRYLYLLGMWVMLAAIQVAIVLIKMQL